MSVSVVGISHRSAPLEVRERFALPAGDASDVLAELLAAGCSEAVLLSTCNRTELYVRAPMDGTDAPRLGARALCARSRMSEEDAAAYLYTLNGTAAVRHLFRVVSSLDSMVVGEAQIQGQVKEAYGRAAGVQGESNAAGPILSRMFEMALHVGARVRQETRLAEGAASIPGAAVELAGKVFGALADRRVLVLGAGKMSTLTTRCLHEHGVRGITLASRSEERAREVGRRFGAEPVTFDRIAELLPRADLVVSATAAPHVVLTREMIEHAVGRGRHSPLVILDIALPRDVEPEVGSLANVFLYDLDDLSRVIAGTLERRRSELEGAEQIIEDGVREFRSWYRARRVVPVIRALRGHAESMRQRELERARRVLRNLSDEEFEAVDTLTRQLLNKVLHSPTTRLREAAAEGRAGEVADLACYLFSLEGEQDVSSDRSDRAGRETDNYAREARHRNGDGK
jgi:glutamyl-tRNA reductase